MLSRATITIRRIATNPDKPEPKPWNREGAKDAKEIFNSRI